MAERLPWTLRAYQSFASMATPLSRLVLARRLRRGKEHPQRLAERRGESSIPRPPGPLIWAHGASVGEMLAVIPLVEGMRARNFNVLVTSGTVTSARLADRRLPEGAIHQFVPLDTPRYAARFFEHWRPNLALLAESDLWPNLILACTERDIPLILVNGRLSERSFTRWRYLPHTISALLSRFDLCLAQSEPDAERYSELGAPRVSMTGNLKLDVPAPPVDAGKLTAIRAVVRQRPVIAAASTHPGEEAVIIDAHRRLRQTFPGLLTIIAPRHPERGSGRGGDRDRRRPQCGRALARPPARPRHRGLRRGHDRRARADLSPRADRVHGRLAGAPRRAEPDRSRKARCRDPAWAARVEFQRNLRGARRGARRRGSARRKPPRGADRGVADRRGGAQAGRGRSACHGRSAWRCAAPHALRRSSRI